MIEMLIRELIETPDAFIRGGGPNKLLNSYSGDFDLEMLRSLFWHENETVRGVAAFVGAELGWRARPLLDDAVTLAMVATDEATKFSALEIIAVNSTDNTIKFSVVAEALGDPIEGVRVLTMLLVANASTAQIDGALKPLTIKYGEKNSHAIGLNMIQRADMSDMAGMTEGARSLDPLMRKYSVISAVRCYNRQLLSPAALETLSIAASGIDAEIARFIRGRIESA